MYEQLVSLGEFLGLGVIVQGLSLPRTRGLQLLGDFFGNASSTNRIIRISFGGASNIWCIVNRRYPMYGIYCHLVLLIVLALYRILAYAAYSFGDSQLRFSNFNLQCILHCRSVDSFADDMRLPVVCRCHQ